MKNIVIMLLFISKLQAQVLDFEGNIYDTVRIGNQIWLKQNLKSTKYADGAQISGGIYAYNNDIINVSQNGYLYSYATTVRNSSITSIQGICPNNFHVPNQGEWNLLFNYIGSTIVGPNLMSNANLLKDSATWNGSNDYNFTLLPSGAKSNSNGFFGLGNQVWYWSSGSASIDLVFFFDNTQYIKTYPNMNTTDVNDAMSCRCIMNSSVGVKNIDDFESKFVIYPNPSNGLYYITKNNEFNNQIGVSIMNLSGQIVYNKKNFKIGTCLDLRFLPDGIYLLETKSLIGRSIKKIIKQK